VTNNLQEIIETSSQLSDAMTYKNRIGIFEKRIHRMKAEMRVDAKMSDYWLACFHLKLNSQYDPLAKMPSFKLRSCEMHRNPLKVSRRSKSFNILDNA